MRMSQRRELHKQILNMNNMVAKCEEICSAMWSTTLVQPIWRLSRQLQLGNRLNEVLRRAFQNLRQELGDENPNLAKVSWCFPG